MKNHSIIYNRHTHIDVHLMQTTNYQIKVKLLLCMLIFRRGRKTGEPRTETKTLVVMEWTCKHVISPLMSWYQNQYYWKTWSMIHEVSNAWNTHWVLRGQRIKSRAQTCLAISLQKSILTFFSIGFRSYFCNADRFSFKWVFYLELLALLDTPLFHTGHWPWNTPVTNKYKTNQGEERKREQWNVVLETAAIGVWEHCVTTLTMGAKETTCILAFKSLEGRVP